MSNGNAVSEERYLTAPINVRVKRIEGYLDSVQREVEFAYALEVQQAVRVLLDNARLLLKSLSTTEGMSLYAD